MKPPLIFILTLYSVYSLIYTQENLSVDLTFDMDSYGHDLQNLTIQARQLEEDPCRADFNDTIPTNSFTIINWVKVSWLIEDDSIWFQAEAETRGWFAIGFSQRSDDVVGSETLVGWADRSGEQSKLHMYNLTRDILFEKANEKSFQYWDEEVCQSREGRTIIKFRRKVEDGLFSMSKPTYKDDSVYFVLAIGEEDKLSPHLESTMLSVTMNPGGNTRPEGVTGRWVYHYIALSLGVLAFFVK